VLQTRTLCTSANNVLVPKYAELKLSGLTKNLYRVNHDLAVSFSIVLYGLLLASPPLVSYLFFNEILDQFVFVYCLCCFTWFFTSVFQASFFSNIGTGELKGNLIGNFTAMFTNIVASFGLGITVGGLGVLFAHFISILVGALIIHLHFIYKEKLKIGASFTIKHLLSTTIIASGFIVALALTDIGENAGGNALKETVKFYGLLFPWFITAYLILYRSSKEEIKRYMAI